MPSHPVAQELLKAFGGGVAAPSANRFGRVSPTTAAHVREDLGNDVDLVLEGGPSEVGIESTIVDLSGGTRGAAAAGSDFERRTAKIVVVDGRKTAASPRHSGGLERHYAPRTPARLVPTHAARQGNCAARRRVAVLAFSRPDERVDFWLRMPREPQGYAQRLYAALRELDGAGCELILVEAPPEAPEWAAVRDRLKRACGG